MSEPAVLLCGHGSRDPEAVVEFEQAAAALRAAPRWPRDFATGYLEFARPTIGEALAGLRRTRRRLKYWRFRACCSPRATSRTTCRGR